jgi:hypothetical protein
VQYGQINDARYTAVITSATMNSILKAIVTSYYKSSQGFAKSLVEF